MAWEPPEVSALNQPHDIEVEKRSDQFQLTPTSPKGLRAMTDYLGTKVDLGTPVLMGSSQFEDFRKHVYFANNRYEGFSIGWRQRFLGQKRSSPPKSPSETEPTLSPELLERLSFEPLTLVNDHGFTVSVARYGSPSTGQLFKVTKPEHSPTTSLTLSLGTLEYYRLTADEDEAAFTPSGPGPTIRTRDGVLLAGPEEASWGSISMNPCWVYCTTSPGPDGLDSGQSAWSDRSVVATPITMPTNYFAQVLGATFGIWSLPRIPQVYEWIESVETLRYTRNGIQVFHGPVRYMPSRERRRHLEELRKQESPIEIPENLFTKNDEFAWEREYRFCIWGWGPPQQNHVILPVSRELLGCYGSSRRTDSLAINSWWSRIRRTLRTGRLAQSRAVQARKGHMWPD